MANRLVDLIAAFCAELPSLREAAAGASDRSDLLEQAVAAARQGEPVAGPLRRLGLPVPEQGTPPGSRGGPSLPWSTSGGHTVDGWYRCPSGTCRRMERRDVGRPLPMCHIFERPLDFRPSPPQ